MNGKAPNKRTGHPPSDPMISRKKSAGLQSRGQLYPSVSKYGSAASVGPEYTVRPSARADEQAQEELHVKMREWKDAADTPHRQLAENRACGAVIGEHEEGDDGGREWERQSR